VERRHDHGGQAEELPMNDDEIVREFLTESHENLDRLDQLLVELEEDPGSRERLSSVFRTIHTIKGTSGFLAFSKLESITHVGENLLSKLRDGELVLDPRRTNALLAMVDTIRRILDAIEETGAESDEDISGLVRRLTEVTEDRRSISMVPAPPSVRPPARSWRPRAASIPPVAPTPRISIVPAQADLEPPRVPSPADVSEPDGASFDLDSKRTGPADTIRVDVQLLDRLMNLVGELVLARNQVLQFTGNADDPVLVATSQRLNQVTTELQEGIMKTRMQPIGSLWNKYPRIVRDLAATCGKLIRLEMEGMETELDRTILEAIRDPLTHIVRNSADHGIERADQRRAAGKPEAGTLRLRAFHEGGKVHIEVSDDGAGIDGERVRAKAIARGLVSAEHARSMSEGALLDLIFLPGLSTAEQVSNVSGRGVGMDVVKTHVERIGGTLELTSERGRGTTLRIQIPLTLAIVPALMITVAGDRYAIPQGSLVELVRLELDAARDAIAVIDGSPILRLRGQLLPLVHLRDVLQVGDTSRDEHVNVVVVSADERLFGLVVDEIDDTEEIVVKPLGKELKALGVYAGATILGDGHIALILDVPGVAARAGLRADSRSRAPADATATKHEARRRAERLLVFRTAEGERSAIPVDAVARLEEIPERAIERTGHAEVVQYRDELLPIVRLGGQTEGAEDRLLQVVVCSAGDRAVGLVVERIEDVVEQELDVHDGDVHGVRIGCAVIHGKVTSLLDVAALVASTGLAVTRRRGPAPAAHLGGGAP
jgi:two-component system chemotaxis sensor kinase CheA